MKEKILVITPFFYPTVGGSQQYMEDLYAQLLAVHDNLAVDVLCYNTEHAAQEEIYRGMHVYRMPCWNMLPGQFALANPFSILRFLLQHGKEYRYIHCSTRFFDSSWWAPLYAKLVGKKIILTDHCAFHPVHTSPVVTGMAKFIDVTLVKWILHLYDEVVATNKGTQAFLQKTYGVLAPVVYGGVNTNIFKPAAKQQHARVRIVYIGRMIASKGVLELFSLVKDFPEADFVFAGPGPLEDVLKKEVKNEGIQNVSILGSLTKKEVSNLLHQSDILVFPSYHHEGFPNILLEAGACKTAVVATDVGGVGEIIENEKTGLLIRPKDTKVLREALGTLITDEKKRNTFAKQLCEEIEQKFSIAKVANEFSSLEGLSQ